MIEKLKKRVGSRRRGSGDTSRPSRQLAVNQLAWWLIGFGFGYALLLLADAILIPTWASAPAISLSSGFAVGMLVKSPRSALLPMIALQLLITGVILLLLDIPVNSLQAVLAIGGSLTIAFLVRIFAGPKLIDLARFGVLCVIAGTVSLLAALVIVAFNSASYPGPDTTADIGVSWWLSQVAGIGLITPLTLAIANNRPMFLTPSRRRLLEALAAIGITCGLAIAVFLLSYQSAAVAWCSQYLLLPLLLWIALRVGLAAVAATVICIDIFALAATASGFGPYSISGPTAGSIGILQLSMVITGLTVYAVAISESRRRSTEDRLSATRGIVDSLLVNSDAMISVKHYNRHGEGSYSLANPRFAGSLGKTIGDVIGKTDSDLFDSDTAQSERTEDLEVLTAGQSRVFISRRPNQDPPNSRSERVVLVTKFPLADYQGLRNSVGAIGLDITDHRRRERLMRLTFDQSPVPMARLTWIAGQPAEIQDANVSLANLLGVSVKALIGAGLDDYQHPEEKGLALVSVTDNQPRRREVRLRTPDERDLWVVITATVVEPNQDETLDEAFALVTLEDVTARRMAEQTLTHQALHDALTGVLNRYALLDRLQASLSRLWRDSSYVAVLFCDLDGFKHLNDTLGHRAGDQMLINVSERLRAVMRPPDAIARLGGDEFVLICEDLPSPGQASVIGERIRAAMRAPFRIDNREYGLTVSIGITTTTDPAASAEDLLRRADLAMYRAKDGGRNRVEFYAEELEAKAVAHIETTEALRRAIAEDRLEVHYQPIIELGTGQIVNVEALVRLVSDDGELVRPNAFIEVAEKSGLVVPLGDRVLDIALDQLGEWRNAGLNVHLSVNVSPRQLARASFAPAVLERLLERGLAPDCLTLEVTEAAVIDATGPTLLTLRRLRSYGLHVGIDDFGTGYSSLTLLKSIPADVLKVDRSFVAGIGMDRQDTAIVSAVIDIAHKLDRIVIAEGVETAAQADLLLAMSCDLAQGFRYGQPMPATALTQLCTGPSSPPKLSHRLTAGAPTR